MINRVKTLIAKGDDVLATHTEPQEVMLRGFPTLDTGAFSGWQAQVLNFLANLLGAENIYTTRFRERVTSGFTSEVEAGQGILRAVREDLEGGYLTDVRTLVSAEVFTDFLEMAEHLHENGYKDPAASLAGAVLEDGLRKIASKNGITVKEKDDLSSLNRRNADGGVYNRLTQKKLQVWADIRNNADHGHFGEYSAEDVQDMIRGIQALLADYL